jgi:hypothetical protein
MSGALRVRRRTRVVGAFPDAQPALNLAAARLRHIAGTAWSTKRYLNIELLKDQQMRGAIVAEKSWSQTFTWTADPDKIIAAVRRGHQVLDSIH